MIYKVAVIFMKGDDSDHQRDECIFRGAYPSLFHSFVSLTTNPKCHKDELLDRLVQRITHVKDCGIEGKSILPEPQNSIII